MLSKKSKIEQLSKSRERRCFPAAASASVCRTRTKLCGRLLVIRRGPSHRRALHAPAVLKNLVHLPEKPFSTASVKNRPLAQCSYVCFRQLRTWRLTRVRRQ